MSPPMLAGISREFLRVTSDYMNNLHGVCFDLSDAYWFLFDQVHSAWLPPWLAVHAIRYKVSLCHTSDTL